MSILVYKVIRDNRDSKWPGFETKYFNKATAAMLELRSNVWRREDELTDPDRVFKHSLITIEPFATQGFRIDQSLWEQACQNFELAYEQYWHLNPKHSDGELKREIKRQDSPLKLALDDAINLPLSPITEFPLPASDELIMHLETDNKKSSYSNPMAVVKGLINNSDRLAKGRGSFTILVKNGSQLPRMAEINALLQTCIEEAKHITRWNDDGSRIYDVQIAWQVQPGGHSSNDFLKMYEAVAELEKFEKALAKTKAAELKRLLAL